MNLINKIIFFTSRPRLQHFKLQNPETSINVKEIGTIIDHIKQVVLSLLITSNLSPFFDTYFSE